MKITISSTALLSALNRARAATMAVSSNPMLSCFKLEADSDTLTVTGTNMDTAISAEAPCNLLASGGVCVNAALLFDIASKVGAGDLEISADKAHSVLIRHGRNVNRLCGMAAEDFPPVPKAGNGQFFKIGQPVLKGIFAKLIPLASKDQSLYIINSVLLDGGKDGAFAVATDKRTMRSVPFVADFEGQFVVPSSAARLIAGACDGEDDAEITLSDDAILITTDGWTVSSKLIEGRFPDWRRNLIPAPKGAAEFKTPVQSLLSAISLAEGTAGDNEYKSVILHLGPSECTLQSAREDKGSAEQYIEGATCTQPITIKFASPFLRALVKSAAGDVVTLYLADPEHPALMDDESGRGVVLPMKA